MGKSPIRVELDGLKFDATPEQEYSAEVSTTDDPVEQGADVTDHARAKPTQWSGTAIVSNLPIDKLDRDTRGNFEAGSSGGYARDFFEKLVKMKDDRKLHTLITPLRIYTNMMITSLSSPTTAKLGDAIQFKIALKEIRLVQSGTATFVTAPKTNTPKPTTKENQAKKQGAEGKTTQLKKLTNFFGLTEAGSGVAAP
jgi:hypothetical protein